jgi:hypothetical protein
MNMVTIINAGQDYPSSGFWRFHGGRNIIIATAKRKQVSFLGQTHPGKSMTKNAETEEVSYTELSAVCTASVFAIARNR